MLNMADRIRYLRDKAGLSQTDLAHKLGISRNAVNSWEMSLSQPSLYNVVQMTRLFHVSADYLLAIEPTLSVDLSRLTGEEQELIIRLVECMEKK